MFLQLKDLKLVGEHIS